MIWGYRMLRAIAVSAFFLFSALSANASYMDLGTVNCSGVGSFDIFDDAVLSCTGDFAIDGNSITSNQSITITAEGFLNLDNLLIQAPVITISALTDLYIGSGVDMSGDDIRISAVDSIAIYGLVSALNGSITLDSGAGISCLATSIAGSLTIGSGAAVTTGSCSNLDARSGSIDLGNGDIQLTPVPVPASVWLFASSVLLLFARRSRPER